MTYDINQNLRLSNATYEKNNQIKAVSLSSCELNSNKNRSNDESYIDALRNNSKDLIKYEVSEDFLSHNKVEFVKGDLIANGSYGRIYNGLSKNTGAIVAIKQIKVLPKIKKMIKEDIKKLAKIEHQNLLKYIGVQCEENSNGIY